jgi:hypothetical protein
MTGLAGKNRRPEMEVVRSPKIEVIEILVIGIIANCNEVISDWVKD